MSRTWQLDEALLEACNCQRWWFFFSLSEQSSSWLLSGFEDIFRLYVTSPYSFKCSSARFTYNTRKTHHKIMLQLTLPRCRLISQSTVRLVVCWSKVSSSLWNLLTVTSLHVCCGSHSVLQTACQQWAIWLRRVHSSQPDQGFSLTLLKAVVFVNRLQCLVASCCSRAFCD